jgi:sporulation protein YlmC with PRC-barrel domain
VTDAGELGSVDDVQLDLARQQALALAVKVGGGLFPGHKAVLLQDVKSVGQDAVTLQDASKLNDIKAFPSLQSATAATDLHGFRVITETGTEVGTVADVDVSFPDGAIAGYVLAGGLLDRLQHQEHLVPTSTVKSFGEKLIVVTDDVVPAS